MKNLLEFKNGQRALVEGNLFENVWPQAQTGYAILFTVRTGDSGDWARVNDITFRNNVLRNVESGFSLHGFDSLSPSGVGGESKRICVFNNLVTLRTPEQSVGISWKYGTEDVAFDRNTFGPRCRFSVFFGGGRAIGKDNSLTNNYLCRQPLGDSMAYGNSTLNRFIPEPAPLESRFTRNVIFVGSSDGLFPHPVGNHLITTPPFTDSALRMPAAQQFVGVGADVDMLNEVAEFAAHGVRPRVKDTSMVVIADKLSLRIATGTVSGVSS